jgi:cyclopropane-fatty-acyl-phospholipid synthase
MTDLLELDRWPSLVLPEPSGLRTRAAMAAIRRAAGRCGVRVELPDDGGHIGPADGPVMTVRDMDAFAARLGHDGKIGFAEAYMAGDWDATDLVSVLTALLEGLWTAFPRPVTWLRRLVERRAPQSEDNDAAGARRNIAYHYDLSNDLFATFLDETMTYSGALFQVPGEPLIEAQWRKVDRLLDATGVVPGTRLLEIGTGWGELAMRAARRGADVTTITLSNAQAELARQRAAAAGLSGAIDVRVQDYRQVEGEYDAIVSVEMIEAVGERWWPAYFRTLQDRLAPGGRVGLQSIVMDHSRLATTKRSWTWTRKYIFPGGLIPSERAIDENLAKHTALRIEDRLRFGSSYARTLGAWRRRFNEAADQVEVLGFDPTFRRMWNFYLAQSEAGFRSGYLDVAQLVTAPLGAY